MCMKFLGHADDHGLQGQWVVNGYGILAVDHLYVCMYVFGWRGTYECMYVGMGV